MGAAKGGAQPWPGWLKPALLAAAALVLCTALAAHQEWDLRSAAATVLPAQLAAACGQRRSDQLLVPRFTGVSRSSIS